MSRPYWSTVRPLVAACSRRSLRSALLHLPDVATRRSMATLPPPTDAYISRLSTTALGFRVPAGAIRVLQTPSDFYSRLRELVRQARRRIFLSTLYIGKNEAELVQDLRSALQANPTLELHILVDALRGCREAPQACCASCLVPLVTEFGGERVRVAMYHTPALSGWRKRVVPARFNEGWGLQHMKIYGADDTVILSGANLSADYFTNRQDRYYVVQSASVAEAFFGLQDFVSRHSFLLEPKGGEPEKAGAFRLVWPSTRSCPSPTRDPVGFRSAVSKADIRGLASARRDAQVDTPDADGSLLFITSQLSPMFEAHVHQSSTEHALIKETLALLSSAGVKRWMFTSGYFNMHSAYAVQLLQAATPGRVLTASPWANGFYGSAGPSGMLPSAYTLFSQQFYKELVRRASATKLLEWRRGTVNTPGGWTYHAKGIWVEFQDEAQPMITVVGSSNFTQRSSATDLEANAIIVTHDPELKREMGREMEELVSHATTVTETTFRRADRRVGPVVRTLAHLLRDKL